MKPSMASYIGVVGDPQGNTQLQELPGPFEINMTQQGREDEVLFPYFQGATTSASLTLARQ